jgi:MFS family permease
MSFTRRTTHRAMRAIGARRPEDRPGQPRLKPGIDKEKMPAMLFPQSANADAKRLIWAKGLRAIADGYVSILLPAYLLLLGRTSFEVGLLTTVTLLGSAALTLLTGMMVARFGYRRSLLAASGLMILTGLSFAGLQDFWPLLVVAFLGTLNPSSGDVSLFLPLEQSLLSQSVAEKDRTALFARYSLAGALMGAFGALLAAMPDLAAKWLGIAPLPTMRGMFLLYAMIGLAAALLYRTLSDQRGDVTHAAGHALGPSRGIVYRLAGLFCIDAFGGGFFVQTILALWLLQTFDLPVATAASIFFWSNLLTAASYLAAPPIARRVGLVNTMVFTHLPSSLCLIAIPFVQNLGVVVGLLLVRSLLSQMDVPTRTSYVMAVVTPAERPAAASVTSVPRSLASGLSPVIAGYLISASSFGWPLLIGGTLKIVYDLALLAMFRHIRPPEERERV